MYTHINNKKKKIVICLQINTKTTFNIFYWIYYNMIIYKIDIVILCIYQKNYFSQHIIGC